MNVVSIVVRLLVGESAGQSVCKYHPSCSQYASDAVRKHGPIRGSVKAAWRVLRCNPWSHGGIDHA
jgi:putative membrane protein insertion efficiency factor